MLKSAFGALMANRKIAHVLKIHVMSHEKRGHIRPMQNCIKSTLAPIRHVICIGFKTEKVLCHLYKDLKNVGLKSFLQDSIFHVLFFHFLGKDTMEFQVGSLKDERQGPKVPVFCAFFAWHEATKIWTLAKLYKIF